MFVSQEYVLKAWPNHERRSSLSRAAQQREYILPVRFDDSPVPGLPTDLKYLSADEHSPAELATIIADKLGISPFVGKASDVPPPRMTSLSGEAVFNYSNHDGLYVIGRGNLRVRNEVEQGGQDEYSRIQLSPFDPWRRIGQELPLHCGRVRGLRTGFQFTVANGST